MHYSQGYICDDLKFKLPDEYKLVNIPNAVCFADPIGDPDDYKEKRKWADDAWRAIYGKGYAYMKYYRLDEVVIIWRRFDGKYVKTGFDKYGPVWHVDINNEDDWMRERDGITGVIAMIPIEERRCD